MCIPGYLTHLFLRYDMIQDISGQLQGISLRGIVSLVQTADGIRCAFLAT